MNIKQISFSDKQYISEVHPKVQIYLHHTAGNASGEQVYQGWGSNAERVATCVVISGKGSNCIDGQIIQGFSSQFWAFHLGLKESTFQKHGVPYRSLDKISIAIEICNWGQLTLKDGKFYNYVNREVPADQVCTLDKPFKGFKYFHDYTDAQIESVKELLLLWKGKYGIPLTYHEDIWDICPRALKGEKGVFTHNSVRTDKVDVYPHPKLIEMLKSI
jgi:N-acetyl-anhydromuramyl-L-alanine amidase AmpD